MTTPRQEIAFEDLALAGVATEANQLLMRRISDGREVRVALATLLSLVNVDPNVRVGWTISVAPPVNPIDGTGWWDTSNDLLKIWDGSAWIAIGPHTGEDAVARAAAAEAQARANAAFAHFPAGGMMGQVIHKLTNDDYDVGWIDLLEAVGIIDRHAGPPMPADTAVFVLDTNNNRLFVRDENDIYQAVTPESIPEQRVLQAVQDPSADTLGKLNVRSDHEVDLTQRYASGGTGPSVTWEAAAYPQYLGARFSDPPIGAATTTPSGTQSIDVGSWYYDISDRRGRIVKLRPDLVTKYWDYESLDILVPGPGVYVGAYDTEDDASSHAMRVGDAYYNTTNATLFNSATFAAGVVRYDYRFLRLLTALDLDSQNSLIEALTTRMNVVEFVRELGDQFDIHSIGTVEEYQNVLNLRVTQADSEAANRMLWLNIAADISGSYQSLGCLLYTSPSPRDS